MTAELCGSRFGRGLVRPGGVGFEVSPDQVRELRSRLAAARTDVAEAVELLWDTPSVRERFEGTGTVAPDDAAALGLSDPRRARAGFSATCGTTFPRASTASSTFPS
jgi:Ni,Fe-hydrogenase III large subunit